MIIGRSSIGSFLPIAVSGTFVAGNYPDVDRANGASLFLVVSVSTQTAQGILNAVPILLRLSSNRIYPSVISSSSSSFINLQSLLSSIVICSFSKSTSLSLLSNLGFSLLIVPLLGSTMVINGTLQNPLIGMNSNNAELIFRSFDSSSIQVLSLPSANILLFSTILQTISGTRSTGATLKLETNINSPIIIIKGLKSYLWLNANSYDYLPEYPKRFVVLNAQTFAISEYILNAIDVVEFEGKLFILTPNALLTLDSLGDEVVSSFIETGNLKLIPHSSFNIYRSVVDIQATTNVNIAATAIQDDNVVSNLIYPIPAELTRSNARRSVVKMSAAIVGNDWQFRLTSPDKPWELTDWTVYLDRIRYRRFS